MNPHVLFIGPFAQRTGYAQAFHDYALAAHRAGISLEIVPLTECDTDNLEPRYAELVPLALERGKKDPTHVIVHTVPSCAHLFVECLLEDVVKILITTWETSAMPVEMGHSLDASFDWVCVPSDFCAQTVRGVPKEKILTLPHTYDPAHWPVVKKRRDSPFTFYSVLGWSERKNPIGLLKAYFSAFSAEDDVVLRIKTTGYSRDDVELLKASVGYSAEELPKLEILTEHLSHKDMVWFHSVGHVFVTAARGEGWNLPAFEASVMGNRVIAPDWGGHLEYLKGHEGYYSVFCQMTPAISPPVLSEMIEGSNIVAMRRNAPAGITARQLWAEPNLNQLANIMWDMYSGYESYGPDVPNADYLSHQGKFEERYCYDVIGSMLKEILDKEKGR